MPYDPRNTEKRKKERKLTRYLIILQTIWQMLEQKEETGLSKTLRSAYKATLYTTKIKRQEPQVKAQQAMQTDEQWKTGDRKHFYLESAVGGSPY